jgi:hypothetical protein
MPRINSDGRRILLAAGVVMGVCALANAQTTQQLQVNWSGPTSLNVGEIGVFTLTANTAALPGNVSMLSFGSLVSPLGSAASIQSVTLATPPWTSIPINPFTNGAAGFSNTALTGEIQLFQVTVLGVALGQADLNITQITGDNRFVWNGNYDPGSGTVLCFVAPIEGSGNGVFQVIPSPSGAAALALGGMTMARRRRR